MSIRYYTSLSDNFNSSTAVNLSDITIDCPVLSGVVTTSTVACSLGNGTIPVVLNNTSSNISGFFTVSYATSTDGGSTFSSYTTLAITEVAKETTDNSTLSISGISHNTVVRIKYTVANASEGLTQAETTISPDITIDCPYTNVVVTSATNGCTSNGTSQGGVYGSSVITIDNSASNVDVTIYVQEEKLIQLLETKLLFNTLLMLKQEVPVDSQ